MSKEKLRVITTFSGIGMQERGLEQTGLYDLEIVNTCEMDTDAIISYAAIHRDLTPQLVDDYKDYPSREEMAAELTKMRIGFNFVKQKEFNWSKLIKSDKKKRLQTTWLACKLNKNVGDIMKVDSFPQADLLTFSFPCTDLSISGKQAGMVKGETRSGLVYEVIRILSNMKETNTLPTYLLMENVAALVNKKNLNQYLDINKEFEDLGYGCVYKILNAKFCGVPQNRERVFAIYYLKDKVDFSNYEFPLTFDGGLRLLDIMDEDADESFYVRNEQADTLLQKLEDEGTLDENEFVNTNKYKYIRNIKVVDFDAK